MKLQPAKKSRLKVKIISTNGLCPHEPNNIPGELQPSDHAVSLFKDPSIIWIAHGTNFKIWLFLP